VPDPAPARTSSGASCPVPSYLLPPLRKRQLQPEEAYTLSFIAGVGASYPVGETPPAAMILPFRIVRTP
jgi:hypothetical protein